MKTIVIADGVTLTATEVTCGRVEEALYLYREAKELLNNPIPDDWSWSDYDCELDYCFGRSALLLGLIKQSDMTVECYGRI